MVAVVDALRGICFAIVSDYTTTTWIDFGSFSREKNTIQLSVLANGNWRKTLIDSFSATLLIHVCCVLFFVISEVQWVVLDAGVTRCEGGFLVSLGKQGSHLELGPLPFLRSYIKVYFVAFSSWRIAYSVECAPKVWILLALSKVEPFAHSGSL